MSAPKRPSTRLGRSPTTKEIHAPPQAKATTVLQIVPANPGWSVLDFYLDKDGHGAVDDPSPIACWAHVEIEYDDGDKIRGNRSAEYLSREG